MTPPKSALTRVLKQLPSTLRMAQQLLSLSHLMNLSSDSPLKLGAKQDTIKSTIL